MGVKPVFYASKDHTETNPEYYLFLIFRNFGENFDLHQKTPDLSRKTLLSRKTTFWEKPIFLLIRIWGKNERLSVEISLAYLPQTHSMRPQKQFEEEDCFCSRKRNFEYFFWLWAENVQSFRKLSPKGVTTELYDSRRYIWKKTSLQEVKFLYLFMVLLRTFWLDGNFHGRQEGILRDQLKGSRKNFWEKPKNLEFCEMTEKFQFFGETALAELSKLHSVCPEKHFEKNVLFREKNMTLNPFSDIGWKTMTLGGTLWEKWTFSRKKYDLESIFWHWKKNFLFWPKTSPGVSKLKCMRPKTVLDNFPEKNEFHLSLRNLLRKFWIAQKLGFCQEGNLRLQRNISGKHFLKETKLSLTFGLWTRIFRVSGKTKLTDLPKLHSMCPEIHFQKKIYFFRWKTKFWFYSETLRENFRNLFATFGHGCQTPILRVQSPYWNKSGIRFIFNFPEFWRKLWVALKNSRFVKQDLTLQENNFLGKNIFSTYTALRDEWMVVCRNMTSIFAANALHSTIEAIWRRRLYFSRKRNFEYNFWLWAENVQKFCKIFPQGCNNRTLCFQ